MQVGHIPPLNKPDGGDDVLMADQLLQSVWPIFLDPGQVCALGCVAHMLLHIRHRRTLISEILKLAFGGSRRQPSAFAASDYKHTSSVC